MPIQISGEGALHMCIDGKTEALARKLKQHIIDKLDNVDEAREMIAENIRTANSQVAHMAELFYENAAQFGITRQLDQVRSHPGTKKSALRGAIVRVLEEYVEAYELTELKSFNIKGNRKLAEAQR